MHLMLRISKRRALGGDYLVSRTFSLITCCMDLNQAVFELSNRRNKTINSTKDLENAPSLSTELEVHFREMIIVC